MKKRILNLFGRPRRPAVPSHTQNELAAEQLALQVRQLRDGINRLAVEIFSLTTEFEEHRERVRAGRGQKASIVPQASDDAFDADLRSFSPERPHPGRAEREVPTEAGRVEPSRAGHDGKAVLVSGAVGLSVLLLVGLLVGIRGPDPVSQRPAAVGISPVALQKGSPSRPTTAELPAPSDPAPVLSVSQFGVGSAVIGRELEGRSSIFAVGAPVVFWTHIRGGGVGDAVRHVWLHEGRERISVTLPVESPSWRTHSRYTLAPGAEGGWVVEVRDSEDRVLVSQPFQCQG